MDFVYLLGMIGSIASIIGLFLPLQTRYQRIMHIVYGLSISIIAALAVHYWQEAQRIHDIERAATALVESKRDFSEIGFTQASLSFLEKHKDLYPGTYDRALMLCEKNDCLGAKYGSKQKDSLDHAYNQIDVASAMQGILRGIGKLEGG